MQRDYAFNSRITIIDAGNEVEHEAENEAENGDEITIWKMKSSLWYTNQLRPVDCEINFSAAEEPQSS